MTDSSIDEVTTELVEVRAKIFQDIDGVQRHRENILAARAADEESWEDHDELLDRLDEMESEMRDNLAQVEEMLDDVIEMRVDRLVESDLFEETEDGEFRFLGYDAIDDA